MEKCDKNHARNEWCGGQEITKLEFNFLKRILVKLSASCHIPHFQAHVTAAECPACGAEEMLRTIDYWNPLKETEV